MDSKTLLAVVLSMGILLAWQVFVTPPPPIMPEHAGQTSSTIATDNNTQALATQTTTEAKELGLTLHDNTVQNAITAPISVASDLLDIRFDNATGDIRSVSILKWSDEAGDPVTFNKGSSENYYVISSPIRTGYTQDIQRHDNDIVVSYTAQEGDLVVTKEYTIAQDSYLIKTRLITSNSGNMTLTIPIQVSIGPNLGGDFEKSQYIFEGAVLNNKKTTERVDYDSEKTKTLENPLWAGYTSKYFLFAAAGDNFQSGKIAPNAKGEVSNISTSITVNPGTRASTEFFTYVGPKEYKLLSSFGLGLQKAIDFGWFYFLSIPMLQVMLFFNGIFHNYGVAIIMLTIIVKIITLPLTYKGMKSMRNMSKLQPEMAKIKEKFKDDPQKMNQATMELYKNNNVNPMSGCLPLLIQIPIFFALYKALLLSIELKGAPFFGWIVDLSAKDPYYITPIIMGISMFLQQKMTPSTADPIQQKIFLVMPIVFTFLFLNFPAGLVIYWLTNNILSIAQQYFINKSKD